MLRPLLLGVFLSVGVAAEGLTLDGLTPGQPAPTSGWSRSPAHPGSFLREGTQIDVKDGRIVSVWGKRLQTSEGGVVQEGTVMPLWPAAWARPSGPCMDVAKTISK